MELILLIIAQAVTAGALALVWRKVGRQSSEIAQLRVELETARAAQGVSQRRVQIGEAARAPVEPAHVPDTALARAARAWSTARRTAELSYDGPTLSPETGRGLVLALMAASPSIGFFAGASNSAVVAAGLSIAAALMLISLRPMWRAAAWGAVMSAGAWALLGFALDAAANEPITYCVLLAAAAGAGLVHAALRRAAPGLAMTLTMSAAALALGSQIGVAGPAGVAFGAIVAMAAIIGAMAMRLEAVLLAAFGAALIGLFVLSGQPEAAIWFTPATAWAGALFLAIAIVRVPQLGVRGGAIAGVGVLAPFAAIAALYGAQHGLADRYAAAGAFLALALIVGAVIALAAARREVGLARLHLTLWLLATAAFASAISAVLLAAPEPLRAPAIALLGAGLLALNGRAPSAVWGVLAAIAAILAGALTALNARLVLQEAIHWPAWGALATTYGGGALIAGTGAYFGARAGARTSAGFFEALTIVVAALGASLVIRLGFTAGATLLQPISFPEAGTHVAALLSASLIAGAMQNGGARGVRRWAAQTLALAALIAALLATGAWVIAQAGGAPHKPDGDALGFGLPAVLFWVHWVFWRARGDDMRTRVAMAAAALTTAAFVTLEMLSVESAPGWVGAVTAAIAFGLALGVNFAPGVTQVPQQR